VSLPHSFVQDNRRDLFCCCVSNSSNSIFHSVSVEGGLEESPEFGSSDFIAPNHTSSREEQAHPQERYATRGCGERFGDWTLRKLESYFHTKWAIALTITLFLALFGLGLGACFVVRQGLDVSNLVPDNTRLASTYKILDSDFGNRY